jgi:hypothetical protein
MEYYQKRRLRKLMRIVVREFLNRNITKKEFDNCHILFSKGHSLEEIMGVLDIKAIKAIKENT